MVFEPPLAGSLQVPQGDLFRCASSTWQSNQDSKMIRSSMYVAAAEISTRIPEALRKRVAISRVTCGKIDDLARITADDAANVIGPHAERSLRLRLVFRFVVDTGHAALVAAEMVHHRLDHVRLDADLAHTGHDRSANIVELPMLHDAILEAGLLHLPRPEADRADAKEVVAVAHSRHRANDVHCHLRQRQRVGAPVLGALGGQVDRASVEINLAPSQSTDFLATSAGQDQQAHDLAEVRIQVAGVPHGAELIRAQDTVALRPLRLTLGADARVHLA